MGLNERKVATSLAKLSWSSLHEELQSMDASEQNLHRLAEVFKLSSSLIVKHPNVNLESTRNSLVERAKQFIRDKNGKDAAERFGQELSVLWIAEEGYREILNTLDASAASNLSPPSRISALISVVCESFDSLQAAVNNELAARKTISDSLRIRDESGRSTDPDAVVTGLTEIATMSILMEAHKNEWFDNEEKVRLPEWHASTEKERLSVGAFAFLAQCWRRWQTTEERCRFLGGEITSLALEDLLPPVPEQLIKVFRFRPESEAEWLNYFANARLENRLSLSYFDLLFTGRFSNISANLEEPIELPPVQLVSLEEGHAILTLSELLAYEVVKDEERPGGLRLVEWIRGYVALQYLVRNRVGAKQEVPLVNISHEELSKLLVRFGLFGSSAERFISAVTLCKSSRDLFDHPLIKHAKGNYWVFHPSLHSASIAKIVLSTLSNMPNSTVTEKRGVQLQGKGKAFETEMRKFLQGQGFEVAAFKVRRDGEEYEFDAMFVWEEYLFVLELKNRTLPAGNPIQVSHFDAEDYQNALQVRRLVHALDRYPDILIKKMPSAIGKQVVPCVVNCLPYSRPGGIDGVYFYDASAIRRFFEEKYIHLKIPHNIDQRARVIHRVGIRSIWAGEKPAATDLLKQLAAPFQIEMLANTTEAREEFFQVGQSLGALTVELTRADQSFDQQLEAWGVNAAGVNKDIEEMTKIVRRLREKPS